MGCIELVPEKGLGSARPFEHIATQAKQTCQNILSKGKAIVERKRIFIKGYISMFFYQHIRKIKPVSI